MEVKTDLLDSLGGVGAVKGRFFDVLNERLQKHSITEIRKLETRTGIPLLGFATGKKTIDDLTVNYERFEQLITSLSICMDDCLFAKGTKPLKEPAYSEAVEQLQAALG